MSQVGLEKAPIILSFLLLEVRIHITSSPETVDVTYINLSVFEVI